MSVDSEVLKVLQRMAAVINDHDERILELEERVEVQMAMITGVACQMGASKRDFDRLVDQCVDAARELTNPREGQEIVIIDAQTTTDIIDKMMGE